MEANPPAFTLYTNLPYLVTKPPLAESTVMVYLPLPLTIQRTFTKPSPGMFATFGCERFTY